jgi:nucleotide-binding universal stress UspA family protein
MITLKHILVATDFSEASEAALDYGRNFARTFGATLHVLHVIENVFVNVGTDFGLAEVASLREDLEAAARRKLETVVAEDDRRELNAKAVLLTSNSAALGIVTYADENKIDLILIGTHGRGTFSKLLLGSVAEKIIRTAPCPVLTVRHPEHEFIRPDALQAASKAK